ncbi:MAG: large subunit ribosomal protein L28 [Sphingobacteriales bacterium]|jgi:large subunit ribosomal protein L28
MARVCELTGKRPLSGNNVSKSNAKMKRKFNPNLITKKFYLPEEDQWVWIKLSTSALRTINKIGITEAMKRYDLKGSI